MYLGAFVNYASDVHLRHAIDVSNGLPLRPHDPRCKDLVCRERKKDEDAKSGVGAQRIGGMHKEFVRDRERAEKHAGSDAIGGAMPAGASGDEVTGGRQGAPMLGHQVRNSTSSTIRSVSTASTTSSFLRQHFERRYFVLKVRAIASRCMIPPDGW